LEQQAQKKSVLTKYVLNPVVKSNLFAWQTVVSTYI